MNPPQEIDGPLSEITDRRLRDMFASSADPPQATLPAAQAELERRSPGTAIPPAPPPPSNATYEILPDGRKRFLKATIADIIIAIILPGLGFFVGVWAYYAKREKKRGATMIKIATALIIIRTASQFAKP